MKRLAYLALAALLAIGPSQAQMNLLTGAGGKFKAASAPTFDNFASAANSSCGFVTSCAVTLTVASGFNVFSVIINNNGGGTTTITTLALSGGCSGSLTLQASTTGANSGEATALFYGTVTGGSCTVTATASLANTIGKAGVAVGKLSNLGSTTPGTGCTGAYTPAGGLTYPCTSGITVPAGGFGVAAIGYNNATTLTSSNLTIGSQANITGLSVGIAYTTSSVTPTFGGIGFVHGAIVAAPWS